MEQRSSGASIFVEPAAPPIPALRKSCLSYSEVLAQSVSVIAPSTVPAAMMGLIFAKAGNATWLSFLIGGLGLLLVSLNINQFASRSASPGSLYSYIVQGLGPTAGVVGGLALLFGYVLTGMSTLCGFALISNVMLDQLLGLQLPIPALFVIGGIGAFCIAFRDIQLSAKMMLVFEGLAILFVVALGAMIWWSKGFALSTAQLSLEGATPSGTLVGVVLVVFGFSGFESSTSLGHEAKNPLKTIPRSVIQSVVLAAVFFTTTAYVVVLGFEGTGWSLSNSEAPLHMLAESIGLGGLGTAINVGVLLSFFSCTLASINSTARILYSMAHHGLISDALGQAHESNQTPHVAVALSTFITVSAPLALHASGIGAFEGQELFATLCSFGFIVVYMLTCLAAPVYLASIKKLTRRALAYSVGGIAFMMLPLIGTTGIPGSDLLPTPDASGLILVAIFCVYMTIGLTWMFVRRMQRPAMIAQMYSAIENVDLQLGQLREHALRASRPESVPVPEKLRS